MEPEIENDMIGINKLYNEITDLKMKLSDKINKFNTDIQTTSKKVIKCFESYPKYGNKSDDIKLLNIIDIKIDKQDIPIIHDYLHAPIYKLRAKIKQDDDMKKIALKNDLYYSEITNEYSDKFGDLYVYEDIETPMESFISKYNLVMGEEHYFKILDHVNDAAWELHYMDNDSHILKIYRKKDHKLLYNHNIDISYETELDSGQYTVTVYSREYILNDIYIDDQINKKDLLNYVSDIIEDENIMEFIIESNGFKLN